VADAGGDCALEPCLRSGVELQPVERCAAEDGELKKRKGQHCKWVEGWKDNSAEVKEDAHCARVFLATVWLVCDDDACDEVRLD
jgi:hypothetical protein